MSARGPGRPPLLTIEDQERISELLTAVGSGMSLRAAAAEIGLSVGPVYRLRRQEATFRQALKEAQRAGRAARRGPARHGRESRYVNQRCRCEKCVPVASAARVGRRRAARMAAGSYGCPKGG